MVVLCHIKKFMNMNNNKTQSAYLAVFWSFAERFSTEIVTFCIGVILARLLSPEDYGIVGITSIFIVFSNVLIESGFGNALIRKRDRTDKDLATAFYFNLIVGIFAYIILCIASPYIASYFEISILTPLVKIVSLTFLLNSLCIVPNAILTARLNIRLQAFISFFAQIPAGCIAIYCAYNGLGVWALAVQQVTKCLFSTILLWVFGKWYPKTGFSRESFQYLWGFGSKLLAATLIGTAFNNAYSFLIGKYIGKEDLGFFSKGQGLANHVTILSNGIISKIALPILSKYQDSPVLLREKFRSILCLITITIAPISAFLIYEAEDIIIFMWTDKWIATVPMFQMIVFSIVFSLIGTMSLILFQVLNRTDLTLKLEFPKKFICAISIAIGFYYGIYGLLCGLVFNTIFTSLVNMYPTKRLLDYSYIKQVFDICKYIVYSYALGLPIHLLVNIKCHLLNIFVFLSIYFVIYISFLLLMRDHYAIDYSIVIRSKLSRNKSS